MSSLIQFFHGVFNMNFTYKKPLLVAVAAAVGSLIPFTGVIAAPIQIGSDGAYKPVLLPLEAKESSTSYTNVYPPGTATTGSTLAQGGGDLDVYIYTLPNYPVSAQKTLSVKVTLTNGATFKARPALICQSTGDNGIVANGVSAVSWGSVTAAGNITNVNQAGGATGYYLTPLSTGNMGVLTFEFPQKFTMPEKGSGACLMVFMSAAAALAGTAAATEYLEVLKGGAAGSNIDMSVEVTYQDVFASVTKTSTVPLIKFVTAYGATISQPTNTVTIDVATESKKFTLNGSSLTQVSAGKVNVSATVAGIRNATGAPISASNLFTSATLLIEGETVSTLGSITFGTAACADLSTPVGTPAAATSGGGGGSITVSLPYVLNENNAYDAMVSGTTALSICLNADGSKVMNNGQLSITVNGVTDGGKVFEIGKGDLALVGRNGTVIRVLNIPNTSSTADRGFLRFYNVSSQPVVVTGTLYGQDGKVLGTNGSKLFDPLQPNDVKALDTPGLMAKVGVTAAWTGRAWLMIQAPISSDLFRVQSLIRSPNGTLINVSADATD
jgi:hypothetical protein